MSVQEQYISDKGGNKIALFEFDTTTNTMVTASLVSGTNYMDLGHISSSSIGITPSTETFKSEDKVVRATDTEYAGKTTGVLMQTSKEIADFVAFTSRGKKYIQYKYNGYKNAKRQDSFAVVEVENGFMFTTPGGASSFNYTANHTANDQAVTISTTQLASMQTAIGTPFPYATATVTIPANQELIIVET